MRTALLLSTFIIMLIGLTVGYIRSQDIPTAEEMVTAIELTCKQSCSDYGMVFDGDLFIEKKKLNCVCEDWE